MPVLYILLSTLVTPSAWEMLTLEEAMLCMLNSSSRLSLPLSGTLELNLPKRHVVMQTNNSCPLNAYFSIKDEDRSFFSTYPLTRKYHPGAKHFSPHPVSSVELSYTVFPVWPSDCTRRLSWADVCWGSANGCSERPKLIATQLVSAPLALRGWGKHGVTWNPVLLLSHWCFFSTKQVEGTVRLPLVTSVDNLETQEVVLRGLGVPHHLYSSFDLMFQWCANASSLWDCTLSFTASCKHFYNVECHE